MPILTVLMPLFTQLVGLIPNPADQAKKLEELISALQQWDAQQAEINKTEAANANLFVAGWRPFIGWVCGFAVLYQYVIVPFATWGFALKGLHVPPLPTLDSNMWELTFGMLGMSGLRTIEKHKAFKG